MPGQGSVASEASEKPSSVAEIIDRQSQFAEAPFVKTGGRIITHAEARDLAFATREFLASALGDLEGQRVCIVGRNDVETLLKIWACLAGAATVIPVNARARDSEAAAVIENSRPHHILSNEAFNADIQALLRGNSGPSKESMRQAPEAPDPDGFVAILHTSGSTGTPKGVPLTNRNALAAITGFMELRNRFNAVWLDRHGALPETQPNALLHAPPTSIVYLTSLLYAANFGTCATLLRRWNAGEAIEAFAESQATNISLTPVMIADLLGHPSFSPEKLASLNLISCSGSVPSPDLCNRLVQMLPDTVVRSSYAMTETTALCATNERPDFVSDPFCMGHPVSGTELRILDNDGNNLPEGDAGRIAIKSASVSPGYWLSGMLDRSSVADGWYLTGDMGVLRDGKLWVLGRADSMIIRGGANIAPEEIESALRSVPGISEAWVFGAPDSRYGQVPSALIRVSEPVPETTELSRQLRRSLSPAKVPAQYAILNTEVPRTSTGKIRRTLLPEIFDQSEKL